MMKNESGRSMVEMLGVLAIIGVLSVGGIAGYTMAMNKYKANEIAAAASQCAMLGLAANALGNTADSDCTDYIDGVNVYGSTFALTISDNKATVKVTNSTSGIKSALNAIAGTTNNFTLQVAS